MSDIYLQITETPTVVTLSAPVVSGALASTVTVANTVTVALDSNSLSALENVTVTVGAAITGTVTVSNFPASQAVTFSSVTISNFPATQTIAGTVTANAGANVATAFYEGIAKWANGPGGDGSSPIYVGFTTGQLIGGLQDGEGSTFGVDRDFPISGTVNIGSALPTGTNRIGVVTIGGGTVTIGAGTSQIGSVTAFLTYSQTAVSLSSTAATAIPIVFPTNGVYGGSLQGYNGTNTYIYSGIQAIGNTSLASATSLPVSLGSLPALVAGTAQIGSVTASISGTVPVSGTFWQATQPVSLTSTTVTISVNPSGSLTTRFGSVTTANTTQITTAVTNTARKYLFAQNISTGSVTIGVGFSPTTTQGIQLSPGSGITFDSFCPTGAVWWLGATTGAAWTILEG